MTKEKHGYVKMKWIFYSVIEVFEFGIFVCWNGWNHWKFIAIWFIPSSG